MCPLKWGNPNVGAVGQLGGRVNAAAVQGDYAYLGLGTRLVILNIVNPAMPEAVGQIPMRDFVRGVVVSGDYVYVADGYGG